MASLLKLFGIDSLSGKKIIAISLVTIVAMSVFSSSFYDLLKLIPSLFIERPVVFDRKNLSQCLIPMGIAVCWFLIIYWKYNKYLKTPQETQATETVNPHKGIVIVLSTPKETPDEIIRKIESEKDPHNPESLYDISGIGQLFKGLYKHAKDEALKCVWPIVTDESAEFIPCIESFLKKFIPSAKVMKSNKEKGLYHLDGQSHQEDIRQTKDLLKIIFSEAERDKTGFHLERTDIIVDFSGGPKHITIGLIFGALDSDIDFQYTEQKSNTVIPLKIDHRIILDKTSEFLLEMYQKLNADSNKDEKKA